MLRKMTKIAPETSQHLSEKFAKATQGVNIWLESSLDCRGAHGRGVIGRCPPLQRI